MKFILLPALGLAMLAAPLNGAPRVFTDVTGRTISAEVVAATADTVTLRMADGTTHTVAQDRLSEADRNFLQSWGHIHIGAQQPPPQAAAKPALKVTWTSERISRKLRPTDPPSGSGSPFKNPAKPTVEEMRDPYFGMSEEWKYHFDAANLSRQPLSNVKLSYEIWLKYKDRTKAMKNSPRIVRGVVEVPLIDAFRSVKVDSDTFKVRAYVDQKVYTGKGANGESVTVVGHKELFVEDILGVSVVLEHNGAEVHKFESDEIQRLRNGNRR